MKLTRRVLESRYSSLLDSMDTGWQSQPESRSPHIRQPGQAGRARAVQAAVTSQHILGPVDPPQPARGARTVGTPTPTVARADEIGCRMAGSTPTRDAGPGGPRTPTFDLQRLAELRDCMNSAHRSVMLARRTPVDPAQLRTARVALLLAMTHFELALTNCRLPMPPRLRQESQVLRRLLG